MKITTALTAFAAASLAAVPALAQPAASTSASSARSLSLSPSVRAGKATHSSEKLAFAGLSGPGLIAAGAMVAIGVGAIVLAAVNNNNNNNYNRSDSN